VAEDRRSVEEWTNFSLVVSRDADTETIGVVGELDARTGVRLTEAIRTAEAGTAERIVVDLEHVSSINRPALTMLWKARVRLRGWGETLQVSPPTSEEVQRFIARTEMDDLLYGGGIGDE
jgi:anti-anti-sigma factor